MRIRLPYTLFQVQQVCDNNSIIAKVIYRPSLQNTLDAGYNLEQQVKLQINSEDIIKYIKIKTPFSLQRFYHSDQDYYFMFHPLITTSPTSIYSDYFESNVQSMFSYPLQSFVMIFGCVLHECVQKLMNNSFDKLLVSETLKTLIEEYKLDFLASGQEFQYKIDSLTQYICTCLFEIQSHGTNFQEEKHINSYQLRLQGKIDVCSTNTIFELKTNTDNRKQKTHLLQLIFYVLNEYYVQQDKPIYFDVLGIINSVQSRFFTKQNQQILLKSIFDVPLIKSIALELIKNRNIALLYWAQFSPKIELQWYNVLSAYQQSIIDKMVSNKQLSHRNEQLIFKQLKHQQDDILKKVNIVYIEQKGLKYIYSSSLSDGLYRLMQIVNGTIQETDIFGSVSAKLLSCSFKLDSQEVIAYKVDPEEVIVSHMCPFDQNYHILYCPDSDPLQVVKYYKTTGSYNLVVSDVDLQLQKINVQTPIQNDLQNYLNGLKTDLNAFLCKTSQLQITYSDLINYWQLFIEEPTQIHIQSQMNPLTELQFDFINNQVQQMELNAPKMRIVKTQQQKLNRIILVNPVVDRFEFWAIAAFKNCCFVFTQIEEFEKMKVLWNQVCTK
ncbi:Conserved_hypothetical protein [Hexamita inflata]|uniref:DNA replication factor Dna2 N-terminal domain-containing protein n=1 Tax=Hexamita inflata TaxID=28002 RepID=A0AA86NZN1_9EUKA|nr:Conserved hypothetical protein [Hexamita inflata]